MTGWNQAQWTARLKHETANANATRLQKTILEAQEWLEDTQMEKDVDGWIASLRALEAALDRSGLRHSDV